MSSSPSARTAEAARFSLAARLTERDRLLLRELDRHGVLTARQITELCFDSQSRARARLVELHRLGVIDRFRPLAPGWGSAPYHYVVARRGAGVLAAERGDDPASAERRWSTGRTLALASSQRLGHILGVSGFYTALVADSRLLGKGDGLVRWLTEWEVAKAVGSLGPLPRSSVRADGWGIWRQDGQHVEFFLEYDRGTETGRRLAAKLSDYEHLEADRGVSAWVLFAFESARRESNARGALADASVAVATAALIAGARPAGPVWLPIYLDGPTRLPLGALGVARSRVAAERGPHAGGSHSWLYPALTLDEDRDDEQPDRSEWTR